MKKRYLWAGVVLSALAVFSSCKKEVLNNVSAEESRIYITNFDSTVNFSNYKTFSVADSVAVISDNQLAGRSATAFDVQLIAALRTAMQERGFILVDKSAKPDLGINVSRVTNTYTGVIDYRDYWDYYGSYYDPYYWGFPGYGYYSPYSYGIYQIQSGGLSIEMLSLKDAQNNGNRIVPVWTALARGTGVFSAGNAASQVAAIFAQSPYLKTDN